MTYPDLHVKFAQGKNDIRQVQSLRYEVFVKELGAAGATVDHIAQRECDEFDAVAQHLMLLDQNRPSHSQIVGTYRLIDAAAAQQIGGFYSDHEFDLTPLIESKKTVLELGRSCLRQEYRGGSGVYEMWSALARYVDAQKIDILFGVASFHGTDLAALAQPLSVLYQNYRAPRDLDVKARAPHAVKMNILPPEAIDRRHAMQKVPALIKGYLRLGGFVASEAWVDHAFNTVDVCLILDCARVKPNLKHLYSGRYSG